MRAPALPTLRPSHFFGESKPAFPLSQPGLWMSYLARNAVYYAARALNLEGKEVLVPAYHHGVEIAALLQAGAAVRFVRLNEKGQLDLDDLKAKLTARSGAVYVIHYAGFPQPLGELAALCRSVQLPLIEDCALALFSSAGGQPLGSVGDASIFCFYKTLPVPHGGALLLRRQEPLETPARAPEPLATLSLLTGSLLLSAERELGAWGTLLRNGLRGATRHARAHARQKAVPVGTQLFDPQALGLGMSPWVRHLLERAKPQEIVRRRRANWLTLHNRLGPERTFWTQLSDGVCPLFYPLRVRDRDQALATLRHGGVEAIDFWRTGHPSLPRGLCPVSDRLREEIIELPCHQELRDDELASIAKLAARLPAPRARVAAPRVPARQPRSETPQA